MEGAARASQAFDGCVARDGGELLLLRKLKIINFSAPTGVKVHSQALHLLCPGDLWSLGCCKLLIIRAVGALRAQTHSWKNSRVTRPTPT